MDILRRISRIYLAVIYVSVLQSDLSVSAEVTINEHNEVYLMPIESYAFKAIPENMLSLFFKIYSFLRNRNGCIGQYRFINDLQRFKLREGELRIEKVAAIVHPEKFQLGMQGFQRRLELLSHMTCKGIADSAGFDHLTVPGLHFEFYNKMPSYVLRKHPGLNENAGLSSVAYFSYQEMEHERFGQGQEKELINWKTVERDEDKKVLEGLAIQYLTENVIPDLVSASSNRGYAEGFTLPKF